MPKRKRKAESDMKKAARVKESKERRVRPRLKMLDAPPVNSLGDLIELGHTIRLYKNIDTIMLWKLTPYLEELNNMIGMKSLKETIFYQIIYYLQGMHSRNNEEYLHTVIYGPPGTGKTTVAKIIGKIYQVMDILSQDGPFKIAHRDDFVAGYLGQTATKTKKLLKSCLGGVLFIDEVYSLAPNNTDKDSFAKEAIDTLTGFLSEHKNDFCCIIAGYEEDVKGCFFAMNKGLERRFPWVHRIDKYDSGELYDIFMKMVRSINWETTFDKNDLISIFDRNKTLFRNFGGDVETFLSKCKMAHSQRVFSLDQEEKFKLSKEDLHKAIEFMKKNNSREEDKIPFGMYT